MEYIRRCETPTLTTGRDFSRHHLSWKHVPRPATVNPASSIPRSRCVSQASNARPTTTQAISLPTWTALVENRSGKPLWFEKTCWSGTIDTRSLRLVWVWPACFVAIQISQSMSDRVCRKWEGFRVLLESSLEENIRARVRVLCPGWRGQLTRQVMSSLGLPSLFST